MGAGGGERDGVRRPGRSGAGNAGPTPRPAPSPAEPCDGCPRGPAFSFPRRWHRLDFRETSTRPGPAGDPSSARPDQPHETQLCPVPVHGGDHPLAPRPRRLAPGGRGQAGCRGPERCAVPAAVDGAAAVGRPHADQGRHSERPDPLHDDRDGSAWRHAADRGDRGVAGRGHTLRAGRTGLRLGGGWRADPDRGPGPRDAGRGRGLCRAARVQPRQPGRAARTCPVRGRAVLRADLPVPQPSGRQRPGRTGRAVDHRGWPCHDPRRGRRSGRGPRAAGQGARAASCGSSGARGTDDVTGGRRPSPGGHRGAGRRRSGGRARRG